MVMRIVWSVLLWLLAAAVAQAAPSGPKKAAKPVWVDPGWRQTVDRCVIKLDEQGLSVTTCDFEFTAADRKGVEAISQQVFTYNGYFDELIARELATVKADGRLIAVDERAIHDEAVSTDVSSPYFNERRKRIIAFSDVTPGDRIRGRLIYKDKRPRLSGAFARAWYVRPAAGAPARVAAPLIATPPAARRARARDRPARSGPPTCPGQVRRRSADRP